jgi:hypothetical protein
VTLYTYGGSPSDVLTDIAGHVVPDYPVNIRIAGSGELVTALYEDDGTTPISQMRSNAADSPAPGAVRAFKCAPQAIEYEYLDVGGDPVRWYEAGREVATSALQAALAAQTAVDDKLDRTAGGTITGDVTFDGATAFTGPVTGLSTLDAARWHNVLDPAYGAVGDGITDDLAAIQAALDAAFTAGGGVVLLPPGRTYCVSSFMVARSNTTVIAYGATIRSIHATTGCFRNFYGDSDLSGYAGYNNITVLGGVWDGNAYKAADSTGVVTATTNIMTFIHSQNVWVHDAVFRDTSSAHALELNAVSMARITNCRFEGFIDNSGDGSRATSEFVEIDLAKTGNSAIGEFDGTPCRDILFSGCWFGPSTRLGSAGRAIGTHGAVSASYFDRITVRDCEIWGTSADVGIRAMYWRDSVIANNKISGTTAAGILAVTDATVTQTVNGLTIEGNIIESSGSDAGIWIDGVAAATLTDVVVRGNIVRNATGYGVRADYAPGVVIQGNRTDTTSQGGVLAQESVRASIVGNSVSAAGSNGINAAGSAGAVIANNIVDTTSANHGIAVGAATSAGGQATITGNTVRAAASAGLRLTAPGTTAVGNKVYKDGGSTVNGVSLSSGATGCAVLANDLSGNSWTTANAIVTGGAAPATDARGGGTLPGTNLVNPLATTTATVANSTAAAAVASVSIPANDAVAGSVYKLTVRGTASTTGTPTLALDVQLGGTSLFSAALRAAAATASALASSTFEAEILLGCTSTGSSGSWWAKTALTDRISAGGSGTPTITNAMTAGAGTTKDTTAAQTLALTATWGTASSSNTITATSASIERIA